MDEGTRKRKGNALIGMLVITSLMLGMLMVGAAGVKAESVPAFTNNASTSGLVGTSYSYSPTFNMSFDTAWRFYGSGPSWASWPSTSGIVTGTPTSSGNFPFVYYLMTYSGLRVWHNWTVTVNPTILPSFTNTPALNGTRNVLYTYTPTFSLPFDSSWRFYGSTPEWADMSSQTGNITGVPTNGGIYAFDTYLLTYTNGRVYHNWTVTIADPRWKVQITNSPATVGYVGVPYGYNMTFNTTQLSSWRFYGSAPYWASFVSTSGNFSGTPLVNGTYQFRIYLTGTDGGLNTYLNWSVSVGAAPSPIFNNSVTLITITSGSSFLYWANTSIPATITILEVPSWITLNGKAISGSSSDIGRYTVTILATSTVFGTQTVQAFDVQVNPNVWPAMNIPSMWLSVIPLVFLIVIGLVCAISKQGFSMTVLMSSVAIGIGLLTWQNVLPIWSLIMTGIIIVLLLFRAQGTEVISIGKN